MRLREDGYPEDDTERARVKIQEEIEASEARLKDADAPAAHELRQYIRGLEFALDEIGR